MMPLLFALGQHDALTDVQNQLRPGIALRLSGRQMLSAAPRGLVWSTLCWSNALWGHARIQVHAGRTKVWNRAGFTPVVCDFFERRTHLAVERARVWRGELEQRRENVASKSR